MIFKQMGDGRYRGSNEKGLFSSRINPKDVEAWERIEGSQTSDGEPVFVPAGKRVEVDDSKLVIKSWD